MLATVADQTAGRRRNRETGTVIGIAWRDRQCDLSIAPAAQERAAAGTSTAPARCVHQGREGCVHLGRRYRRSERQVLLSERTGGFLHVAQLRFRLSELFGSASTAIVFGVRNQLDAALSRFANSAPPTTVTPVTLPPGRLKLATMPTIDRVVAGHEDDRDHRRCRLGCAGRGGAERGDDRVTGRRARLGRESRQAIGLTLHPMILDHHIAGLDMAGFAQATAKRDHQRRRARIPGRRWRSEIRSPASPAAARAPRAATQPPRRRAA